MPDDAAPVGLGDDGRSAGDARPAGDARLAGVAASDNPAPPDFPANVRVVPLDARSLVSGAEHPARFLLSNPHAAAVLHVRLSAPAGAAWLRVTPAEVALGPGEKQAAEVRADAAAARAALDAGAAPVAPIQLTYQRLRPGAAPSPTGAGAVYVRLPVAACPACGHALDDDPSDGIILPDVCPRCFERLRPCPVCGAPNSWLARRCVLDSAHIVRAAPDWPCVGGGPEHAGSRGEPANAALSRRWSFPSVPPAARDAALLWSAPVAAYGLVAASAATAAGEAHLYAFDALTGAPLWEPYPLPDPIYPERGGAAIANGRLFAATVEGLVAGVDALRGTRLWETSLPGRVYGAVVPAPGTDDAPLLVPVATPEGTGCLTVLEAATGRILQKVPLSGPPDSAPAVSGELALVHDDGGTLTAIEWPTGRVRWTAACGANFDAAPVVSGDRVLSATTAGTVLCHAVEGGAEIWRTAVTGVPFAGTPACDDTLLYAPADDGVHLVSVSAGRAVRRYGLSRPVRSAPVLSGGVLFFGATDGSVYGVDATRSLQTLYETGRGSQIAAAPALADGALFVAATNGVLYALAVG